MKTRWKEKMKISQISVIIFLVRKREAQFTTSPLSTTTLYTIPIPTVNQRHLTLWNNFILQPDRKPLPRRQALKRFSSSHSILSPSTSHPLQWNEFASSKRNQLGLSNSENLPSNSYEFQLQLRLQLTRINPPLPQRKEGMLRLIN